MLSKRDSISLAAILLLYLVPVARGTFVPYDGRFRTRSIHATKVWARRTNADDANPHWASTEASRIRARIQLNHSGEVVSIISRSVAVTNEWSVTIYELESPAPLVELYWDRQSRDDNETVLDPFGLVAWPGAVVAAREALTLFPGNELENKTVLILGAGPGVEAMAMAKLGAKQVIATDIHTTTLQLIRYGSKIIGLDHVITTQVLDMFSQEELPDTDVVVAADVMYDENLGRRGLGNRLAQLLKRHRPPKIIVTDSQRFTDFIPDLQARFPELSNRLAWQERLVDSFTGSGVLVDEDQTYNVTARVLLIGFDVDSA